MDKTLNNTSGEDAAKKVSDIEFFGDPDTWKLICKASSKEQKWMKSTKAMQISSDNNPLSISSVKSSVVLQVTT